MDRTIPSSGNEEIKLYMRTYYSLLRSTRAVPIETVEESHKGMRSALHVGAHDPDPDMAALIYSLLRLPDCLNQVSRVVMGQSARVFARHGYGDVVSWQEVSAPGRRRRSFFDGNETLAVYIASRSDIDDLVPMLTAYQIERGKLHDRLRHPSVARLLEVMCGETATPTETWCDRLAELTGVPTDDWSQLYGIWRSEMPDRLLEIARTRQSLTIQSLSASLAEYSRATRHWWMNVERAVPEINFEARPVYFVSSNTHSLANLLSGYPLQEQGTLEAFIHAAGSEDLRKEYEDIREEVVPSSWENFQYYVWKKYESVHPQALLDKLAFETDCGIVRVPSEHNAFDIEVQVIQLRHLRAELIDPRLQVPGLETLVHSDALIINIDYPLGMAAYQVLTEIARNIADVRGVFIMGKGASLNSRIGDVMIPSVVHDEQSLNTYLFTNCFISDDVAPYLVYGTVLDNQKAITVPGTFLQNQGYMSVFYNEGYTDMEMEAGPYLGSVYEMVRPQRHPYGELVNLTQTPFPIGFLHYASDTPFSKGKNLGAQNLSYYGMDPTYATMIAILRRLFMSEVARCQEGA